MWVEKDSSGGYREEFFFFFFFPIKIQYPEASSPGDSSLDSRSAWGL